MRKLIILLLVSLLILGTTPLVAGQTNIGKSDHAIAEAHLVEQASFYSYAIATEKAVRVFGFYVGPISPNNKRINFVSVAEGKLRVQEAGYASPYDNKPSCVPMLFLPKVWLEETPALGEKVISSETASFFRGDGVVTFPSKLPHLEIDDFALTIVKKQDLPALKETIYTTVSPEKRAVLEAKLDENNRAMKYQPSPPEKPKLNMWQQRIPRFPRPLDSDKLFVSFKNQTVADLQNFFNQGSLLSKFPNRLFSVIVYLSEFGIDGKADYKPILEVPPLKISDLNMVSKQVKDNFGVSPVSELAPFLVQDEGGVVEISLDDALKYRGAECPVTMLTFRATQLAISELWDGNVPKRNDFKVITAAPVEGVRDCIEFITRAVTRPERKGDFKVVLPEEAKGLSLKNFVFTFIRKSTGEQIKIWVKEGVFPVGIFKLKGKIVSGKATMEEKKAFELEMMKTRVKLLKLPLNELFRFEKKL